MALSPRLIGQIRLNGPACDAILKDGRPGIPQELCGFDEVKLGKRERGGEKKKEREMKRGVGSTPRSEN